MVRYSKKLGKKRTVIARKMHRKRGNKSGKSLRRSRLLKAERKRKRRKTKMRGGSSFDASGKQEKSVAPAAKSAKKYNIPLIFTAMGTLQNDAQSFYKTQKRITGLCK